MEVSTWIEIFSFLLVVSFAGYKWGSFEKAAELIFDEATK